MARIFTKPKAFSLVELLVVMAVVSILAAMLMPSLSRVKERARRVQCMSNLRQVGLAQHQYANDNDGSFFWTGGPGLGGTLGGSSGHAWQGLSNYVRNTEVLFCPSGLRANFGWSPANQMTNTWGGLINVHNHYGYVYYMNTSMEAKQILAFETPNYYFHEREYGFNTFGFHDPPWDYLEIDLGTAQAFKSDGTSLFGLGPKPSTPTSHGTEGSNILFVDGRVEWKRGPRIGPFYTYALPPIPGAWWGANGWGCIVIY